MSYRSKGPGKVVRADLAACPADVVFEDGVRIFHPNHVFLGAGIYVGHDTILEAYHRNALRIGEGSWVGAQCFFHAAGGLTIGRHVGIGPGVRILTSHHTEVGRATPILHAPLALVAVHIEDDVDIGTGATILPGVTIGRGAQIGAGAVVSRDIPPYAVAAGVPAKVLRMRPDVAATTAPKTDDTSL